MPIIIGATRCIPTRQDQRMAEQKDSYEMKLSYIIRILTDDQNQIWDNKNLPDTKSGCLHKDEDRTDR